MKRYNYLTLFLSLFLLACGEEESSTPTVATEDVEFQLSPEITVSKMNTRITQNNPNNFVAGSRFALSIFPKDAYESTRATGGTISGCSPYVPIPEYRCIRVTAKGYSQGEGGVGIYTYNYVPQTFVDKDDNQISKLYLKRGVGPLDLYCYHPFMGYEVEKFEAIPFKVGDRLANNDDYMIPTTNGPISINPSTLASNKYFMDITIPLRHIMTQLEFKFDVSFAGPDLLPYFYISTSPGSLITTEGTFSYYDGVLTPTNNTNQFTFIGDYIDVNSLPTSTPRKNAVQGFVLPAIEVLADSQEEMIIEIKFNANTPVPVQVAPFKFKLSDLTVVDNGTTRYGLITGYKYIVSIKVDNFIKYSGTPYVKEWGVEKVEMPI